MLSQQLSSQQPLKLCPWSGDLARCVPFYLHIDEGTGLRKSAVLIVSAQTLFGQETSSRFEAEFSTGNHTAAGAAAAMGRSQFHSSRGSSYKSRFLFVCLPKKYYTRKNAWIYNRLLKLLSEECLTLFADGVEVAGTRFYGVCLGLKADQPAQAKAGCFNRSFQNLGRDKGCCYECLAGRTVYPFEQISANPRWLATIDTAVPWDPASPSPLLAIPHRLYQSATFFKRDPFHLWKQSIGGHFVASAIVMLMDFSLFSLAGAANSVEALFERASLDFAFWARHEWRGHVRPQMKNFTRQRFHFSKATQFPFLRCKGSDIMLLTRWLRHILVHGLIYEGEFVRSGFNLFQRCSPDQRPLLREVAEGAEGALEFFHLMHTSGIWLEPNAAARMAECCYKFCKAYVALAEGCHARQLCRFHMEPSLHGFFHFYIDLRNRNTVTLNPACSSCEQDEDYIGKIARLARCVHGATTDIRVIDRLLLKTYFELEEPDL
eukprot:Skav208075  [mRNA]  locus=scaffold1800:26782:28251:- [translate_table: standard]